MTSTPSGSLWIRLAWYALLFVPACGRGEAGIEGAGRSATAKDRLSGSTASVSATRRALESAVTQTGLAAPHGTERPDAPYSVTLPWGSGEAEVGLRPVKPLPESVPEGPSALAVAPAGEILVLDRLKGRVLSVDSSGARVVARVPRDAEDLAAGPENVLGAYSALRARVFLRTLRADASPGEMAVPRELRLARGILIGPSLEIAVQNAHQETYRLGRPDAPLDLPAVLHSKREGEWLLGDGRGLAVRRHRDGRAELLVLGRGLHAPVLARHGLPGRALAARLIGLSGDVACLRIERARSDHGPKISVDREALCLRVASGAVLFRRPLPDPASSLYQPRRELALGGAPLRLACMSPGKEGLTVAVWPVPEGRPGLAAGPEEVRP